MKITTEIKVIPGAPLEGVNPLPKFRERKPCFSRLDEAFPDGLKEGLAFHIKSLPYLMQDRYSRKRIPLKMKCFVLENEYLRAEFLPEYGGRLYSLYDKKNNYDLVLRNPVIQPGNLAIRNAWLSGGIEWNCGNIGHCATTCDNVFAAILQDDEGNDFLRIYEFERLKSVFWQVDFHLPDDSPYLITHVKIVNPYDEDTTIYWWSNVAVEDVGETRVLASGKDIITFTQNGIGYECLPYVKSMPGADVSYPSRATRSFDYFIQPNTPEECTWEAAAYGNGVVFYERSTPPLSCKKMFCWGNHRSGKHWQEFLSDKGSGYYAEIQAGIAPSQQHDRLLPKNGVLQWTQCFGGVKLDAKKLNDPDYHGAVRYLDGELDGILDADAILGLDRYLQKLAETSVSADRLVHCGSGFGALEIRKMEKEGRGVAPESLYFPVSTVGKAEYPWAYLLEKGVLPREDTRDMTPTYMISSKWLPLLADSIAKEETWYSLLQYGIAVYEGADHTVTADHSCTDEDCLYRMNTAEKAWLKSVSLEPSTWGYRNLAVLETQRGDYAAAEAYYDRAIALHGAFDDHALAAEYLDFLAKRRRYEKLWEIYESLPPHCREKDRVDICAAFAAVRLRKIDFLDDFFARDHHDIREGEESLTDIWFTYSAYKLAAERGIVDPDSATLDQLIDEAWDRCPPPEDIDFRMSLDRENRYRI